MAKVSSARPASRGSQTGASAARSTRSTRSQSNEPAESATTLRQSSRKAPQPTVKASPKRRGRPAKNATDLDTVDEDDGVEEQLAAELHAANDEEPVEELEANRRISRNSGMSGTTAKTSFSQEEISELDAEVIVDVLPSLATAAEDLAKLLVVADPKARTIMRKEIRTEGSRHNKLYKTRLASFSVNKSSFGSTEYIQPNIILRALLGVQNVGDVPPGPWRPDSVIYKINLASMLRTILVSFIDNVDVSDEAFSALARLEVAFPNALAGPGFKENAFYLCLDLLTQLAIMRLHMYTADPSFSPQSVIINTFYDSDEDGDSHFRHHNDLHLTELPLEDQAIHAEAIRSKVDELITAFESSTLAAALRKIRNQNKWETFVQRAVEYYLARKLELDEQIAAVGGVDKIMLDLSQEVERRTVTREAELKRRSLTQPGGTPKRGFGKAGIQRMKELEALVSAEPTAAPAATAPVAPTDQPPAPVFAAPMAATAQPSTTAPELRALGDDWQRMEDDDYASARMQSTARSGLEAIKNLQTAKKNSPKGKARFIDPQPGAVRVSFDDSQDNEYPAPSNYTRPAATATGQAPYYQSPLRASYKRTYVQDDEEDFEPTQDPPFEADTRDTAAADQRRRAAPQQRPAPPRFTASSAPEATPAARGSATLSPSKRQRKNPGSSIPDPLPPLDPDENVTLSAGEHWEHAKVNARQNTVIASQKRPTQIRRPWSVEEERALLDMIAEHGEGGISYSKLKKFDDNLGADARLATRSAEDIRFKARNMKETMLRATVQLPENWEHVMLDKKAIDKLHNMGIPYNQEARRARGPTEIDTL